MFGKNDKSTDYAQTISSALLGEGGFAIVNDTADYEVEISDIIYGFIGGAGDVNGDG
jgi:hypothetical protein